VALNDRWRVVDIDIVQFLGVDAHDLEPFGLLAQGVHTSQCPLDLISIRQHLLDEPVVLLYHTFLYVFGLQVGEGIGYPTAIGGLLVFVEAGDAAALDLAARTGVLIEGGFADVAELFAGGVSGSDEL
jgi:hypothetical protein